MKVVGESSSEHKSIDGVYTEKSDLDAATKRSQFKQSVSEEQRSDS